MKFSSHSTAYVWKSWSKDPLRIDRHPYVFHPLLNWVIGPQLREPLTTFLPCFAYDGSFPRASIMSISLLDAHQPSWLQLGSYDSPAHRPDTIGIVYRKHPNRRPDPITSRSISETAVKDKKRTRPYPRGILALTSTLPN